MPDDGTGWRHVDWSPWLGQPGTAGVLTDYDGTLAAVVADRDKAAPLPGVPGIVAALAERFALVAVVSGRPVEYLESQLGRAPNVTLVGLYGLERIENGEHRVMDAAAQWEQTVASAATAVTRTAPPGLEVEMKGLTLVLHARRAPETLQWAQQWAAERATSSGLVAQPGRFSVELLPPVRVGQGHSRRRAHHWAQRRMFLWRRRRRPAGVQRPAAPAFWGQDHNRCGRRKPRTTRRVSECCGPAYWRSRRGRRAAPLPG